MSWNCSSSPGSATPTDGWLAFEHDRVEGIPPKARYRRTIAFRWPKTEGWLSRPNDGAITETIIAVARHLEQRVVAEGLETAQHRAFLEAQARGACQRCYFSRTLPTDQFERLWQVPGARCANESAEVQPLRCPAAKQRCSGAWCVLPVGRATLDQCLRRRSGLVLSDWFLGRGF